VSGNHLYAKHADLADRMASRWRVPGCEPEDLRQEARLALWEACQAYDGTGRFRTFASHVVWRHMADLLRVASKRGNAPRWEPLTEDLVGAPSPYRSLHRILDALGTLSWLEREALRRDLDGTADGSKRQSNALYSARKKLKEAA